MVGEIANVSVTQFTLALLMLAGLPRSSLVTRVCQMPLLPVIWSISGKVSPAVSNW